MNYVIFTSIGIFAALFFIIVSYYDISPKDPSDLHPQSIAQVIRAEQRKNVMIAKEKYGIEVNITQIAEEPDITKPILPASESITEEEKKERKNTHLFTGDGLPALIVETVKKIFSPEK